jgi:probable selenate reductase FAD-binding subunit
MIMRYPVEVTRRLREFEYISPSTISDAVSSLRQYGKEAELMSGGTDLVPLLKKGKLAPRYIIGLNKIRELDYIHSDDGKIKIGALTKVAAIEKSDTIKQECSSLFEASKVFATQQVRNMATIGGNICRSSPSADLVCALISFDSQVKLIGENSERTVLLEEFFTGPGTNVLDHEVLTEIIIPLGKQPFACAFQKITRSSADIAKINCAVKINMINDRCDDIRIVLGAVASKPIRARNAENVIKGERLTDEVLKKAGKMVCKDIFPINDVRSTAVCRTEIAEVLVKRLVALSVRR